MDTWIPTGGLAPARQRPSPVRHYTFEIGAVLCVALIAATAWAVLAAGWVNGGGGAAVVAVTSVVEAALLAQARTPRIVAALAAPFLGLAAIVPTTLAALPPVAGQTGAAIVGHYARALVTGLASTQDWDFTVGLCAVLFLCGYWLGWTALREHRGVLAVIPVFSVLATNVVNAKNPDPIALPEVIAIVLALAVIAAAYLGGLGDRWTVARITPLGGMRLRFAGSTAAVAVGLTVVALLLPPATDTDISGKLFPSGLGHGSGAKSSGSGPGTTATIGFNPSVVLGGRLVSEPKTVLTYTTNTSATVYLGVTDDTYFAGGNWFAAGGGTSIPGGYTWTGLEFDPGPLPRDDKVQDGGVGKQGESVQATIVMQPGATGQQSLVPFTGEPVAVDDPGVAYGTLKTSDEASLLTVDSVQLERDLSSETTVKTTAVISTASVAQLRAAGTDYPVFTDQYVELPNDGSNGAAAVETIRAMAKAWTQGTTNPYDEAIAIEQHLRDPVLFAYSLNPPAVPSGIWPVVYFLTTSHRGYCQYFASAMGSMLRSLNIPTRLVSGYGPGTTHDVNGPHATGTIHEQIVTSSDAHTWVEAYFPGYGWIPFEPTPPSPQGNYQPFPRGTSAATTGPSQNVPTAKPGPTVKPGNLGGSTASVTPATGSHKGVSIALIVAAAIAAGAVVLVLAALLWLTLPRTLTGAWRRVETLGALSGVDRRRAETHTAFAARLARARPRAGPALGELAAVTARAEFSAAGATATDRTLAVRTWRRALLAAITRRPARSPG